MAICLKLGPSSIVLSMTGMKSKSGSRVLLNGGGGGSLRRPLFLCEVWGALHCRNQICVAR
jgi:hypothetical protein